MRPAFVSSSLSEAKLMKRKLDDEQKCCVTIIAPPGDALSILAVRLCQTLRKGRPRESMVQYQGIILR